MLSRPHQQLDSQVCGNADLDGAIMQRAQGCTVHLQLILVPRKRYLQRKRCGIPVANTTACM